jgi:hypothetical protein
MRAGIFGHACDAGGGGLFVMVSGGCGGVGTLAVTHGYAIVGHAPGTGGDDDRVLDIFYLHVLTIPAASVHGHCGGVGGAVWNVGRQSPPKPSASAFLRAGWNWFG